MCRWHTGRPQSGPTGATPLPDKFLLASEEATREAADMDGQDQGRFNIAKALLKLDRVDEAIAVLHQVTHPGLMNAVPSWIESIQKKHQNRRE